MKPMKKDQKKNNNKEEEVICAKIPTPVFNITKNFCDNLFLSLNRYFYHTRYKGAEFFKSLLFIKRNALSVQKNELLIKLDKRTCCLAQTFQSHSCVSYSPLTRLMIGIGGESAFNTNLPMSLHQTYGFPYIPATAIKGCLRHYCESEKPEGIDINKLFGVSLGENQHSTGCLVFFDTFPTEFELAFDVMTPHDPKYYSDEGKTPPSDMMNNKIPLFIPCVTNNSIFNIYIACTDKEEWDESGADVMKCLKEALSEYGLGSKTSYGYGLGIVK